MPKPRSTCSIEGCERPFYCKNYCRPCYEQRLWTGNCAIAGCDYPGRLKRGWCQKHYRNWRLYGHPLRVKTYPWEPRFWAKVNKNGPIPARRPELGPCWVWTTYLQPSGYAYFRNAGKLWRAHRFIYTQMVKAIPDGLELDHLCRNRCCVNPAHLEPVTSEEHHRRSIKTHCKHGHEFTPGNTRVDRKGVRHCKACQKVYKARYCTKIKQAARTRADRLSGGEEGKARGVR